MAISPKIQILLVDDQGSTRTSIRDILKDAGFKNVHDEEDAKKALKYIDGHLEEGESLDLVISDYDMPGMDGTEFFQEIRKNNALDNTKFILISGCADQSFIVEAVKLGIRSILLKPFSKQDLINELAKVLN